MPALEIITIGDELLLGERVDTNSAYLAARLLELGIDVPRITSVGDDRQSLKDSLAEALERTGGAVTTGGLGPTADDVTKEVVAGLFHRPLRLDKEWLEALKERFRQAGQEELLASNRSQAEVPEGASIFPNPAGTAPGLALSEGSRLLVILPGPPRELKAVFEGAVAPFLRERFGLPSTQALRRRLRTTGIPEARLAELVSDVHSSVTGVAVAFLPSPLGVDLRLTAWGLEPKEALRCLDELESRLRGRIGSYVYATGDVDLAEVVARELIAKGDTLAVAESCTGGLIGDRLSDVPGSSTFFLGSVVAYANAWKESLTEVPQEVLKAHGSVSAETARAMAEGVRRLSGATYGLSVTGIVGPTGGSAEKPVGTVHFGLVGPGGTAVVHRQFQGERRVIKERAAQAALELLRRRVLALE